MVSEAGLQAIEANLESNIWRVPGKLGILQSSVVHHLHNLSKSIQSCQTVLHVTKIFKNY